MAGNLKPLLQKQFQVQITGIGTPIFFTKVTAPKVMREVANYNDGQTGVIRKLTGFVEYENVTLTKTYDGVNDKALYAWFNSQQAPNAPKFVVTITPVTNDQSGSVPAGAATLSLTDCEVVSLSFPSVDRTGSGTSEIVLEIIVNGFSYQ